MYEAPQLSAGLHGYWILLGMIVSWHDIRGKIDSLLVLYMCFHVRWNLTEQPSLACIHDGQF